MIKLGERQTLKCVKKVDFGVYVGTEEEKVKKKKKQVPETLESGDEIDVFIYRDSSDRLIATINQPYITLGEMAVLEVKGISKIGAFLDWGLEKDLFLPFKEQTCEVVKGKSYLVYLYIDKSNRLAATMNIHRFLENATKYQKDDTVTGIVYEINKKIGAFVAIDNEYYGLIPAKEMQSDIQVGDMVNARITDIREDGKINLSPNKKAYIQIDEDAQKVLDVIKEYGGELPYGEKANPEIIKRDFKMSKNAFKRALGHLYKNREIDIQENSIKIISK